MLTTGIWTSGRWPPDNEINPDVLGYIFEKYINQKQMGAYYTKEDITEYIAKNTVLPFLLERARERCKVAFEGRGLGVGRCSRDRPDRYLYPALKRGVIDAHGDAGGREPAARFRPDGHEGPQGPDVRPPLQPGGSQFCHRCRRVRAGCPPKPGASTWSAATVVWSCGGKCSRGEIARRG